MSKYTIILLGLILGVSTLGFAQATKSVAASQAWVENFVSNYVANTKSEAIASTTTTESDTHVTIKCGDGVLTMEKQTDAALLITNTTSKAVSSGVLPGMLAVWNGRGKYINSSLEIVSTSSNLVYNGVGSIPKTKLIHFDGWFDVLPVLIQPAQSLSITNTMERVQ